MKRKVGSWANYSPRNNQLKPPSLKNVGKFFLQEEKSWQDGAPKGKNDHLAPKGDQKVKPYKKPKIALSNEGDPSTWDTSEWDTLENPVEFVPGKDKGKDTMQVQEMESELLKLQEELAGLETEEPVPEPGMAVVEGLITPDMGGASLNRSFFGGIARTPGDVYEPNTVPSEPAPEEIPPGYEQNFQPGMGSPEQNGSRGQQMSIVAPKQFVPQEGVHRRLHLAQKQVAHFEAARKKKLERF